LLSYHLPPVQEIITQGTERAGVRLLVRREDLNHPLVSGNKWWKLKYNLEEAIFQNHDTILTFGGAYSNHLFASAAAAKLLSLKSIGIVRGEETLPLNHTLSFARQQGMMLHYVSREAYRQKDSVEFISRLQDRFGRFYLIPEGGTNDFAVEGCKELGTQLKTIDFDFLAMAVGTGGTMAGILCGLDGKGEVLGVSVLKGGEFLEREISDLVKDNSEIVYGNWRLLTSYHHGGYAKVSEPLLALIQTMKDQHNLPLDTVYTGKLLWAIFDMVEKGWFGRGSTILALHTGGVQNIEH
jgi:1-aminocyclopropane-1-carboxylate deaminase